MVERRGEQRRRVGGCAGERRGVTAVIAGYHKSI